MEEKVKNSANSRSVAPLHSLLFCGNKWIIDIEYLNMKIILYRNISFSRRSIQKLTF